MNDPRIRQYETQVKEHFQGRPLYRFKGGKTIGMPGETGVAFVFEDSWDGSKIVVKKAGPADEEMLRKESRVLNKLKWATHIVNPITLYDYPWDEETGSREEWDLGPIQPCLIMECLVNGTLQEFLDRYRVDQLRRVLPNRILWAIFLCMVRGCCGMAYPPPARDDTPETTRPGGRVYHIAHNDLHPGNIVFAGLDAPPLVEHTLVPKAKIIDFGLSQVVDHTVEIMLDRASARDLEDFDQKMGFAAEDWGDVMAAPPDTDTDTDIEGTMSSLSLSSDPSGDESGPTGGDGGGSVEQGVDLLMAMDLDQGSNSSEDSSDSSGGPPGPPLVKLPTNGIAENIISIGVAMTRTIIGDSTVSPHFCREDIQEHPNAKAAGPEMQRLVSRCLAANPVHRPRLDDILQAVIHQVALADNGSIPDETDDIILAIIKSYIYDAPVHQPEAAAPVLILS